MHSRAVIPADQVPNAPLMPIDVLRPRRRVAEILDEWQAFRPCHTFEMGCSLADVERLNAALVMNPHARVRDRWVKLQEFSHLFRIADPGAGDKIESLQSAGIKVADSPASLGEKMLKTMNQWD